MILVILIIINVIDWHANEFDVLNPEFYVVRRLPFTFRVIFREEFKPCNCYLKQARAEVEAALETARQAKEAAEMERRRQAEMRQAVEQITWEQKEMDLRLENRERHVNDMIKVCHNCFYYFSQKYYYYQCSYHTFL